MQTSLWFGGDYNPGQWPSTVIDDDLALLERLGANTVTLPVFGWELLHPGKDRFEFGWLDRVLERLADREFGVVMATPTAAQPAWMSAAYTEILPVDTNGRRRRHGGRGNYCPTSTAYLEASAEIASLLAERYREYAGLRWNSIKITVISVSLTVLITTLAGYALSRFRFAGKKAFMTGILILNVFPAVLSIIALFGMMQQIGTQISWLGLDTHGGLIAIYVSFGMGINVLLVKAYIDRLPRELDESALVDGATYGQVFRKIVFPLIRPIIVTVSVLQFFAFYGDFVIARVMLRSTDNLTVMVGLLLFQTQRFEQDWGVITAGAVLASLPVLLLYIPVQKYVISGLTSGSVKE